MIFIFRSPLTYGMVGHLKTISILAGGYLLFKDSLNIKQLFGILLTLFGLVFYTFVKIKEFSKLESQLDTDSNNSDTKSQLNLQDVSISVK